MVAVGGYGRGELAPGSDIDLLFLCPYKRTPHVEQMAEFLLYKLWDLGLKVGQAVRSAQRDDQARPERSHGADRPARGAGCSGARAPLFAQLEKSFEREIVAGRGPAFAEAKLAERDQRHQRMGDSRFLLEPNIKEGKGGLRDLQTLLWIGALPLPQRGCGRAGAAGPAHPPVAGHLHALAPLPVDRALPPPLPDRPGRGAADLRPAARDRAAHGLPRAQPGARGRAVHEALLPGRQGRRRADPDLLRRARGAAARARRASRCRRFGFGRRRINGFVVQGNRLGIGDAGAVRARADPHARAVPPRPGARARHPPAGAGRGHPPAGADRPEACARTRRRTGCSSTCCARARTRR